MAIFTFTDSPKTDGVNWPLALYYTEYEQALEALAHSANIAGYANVETLTATKTLTDDDNPIHVLTPSGANFDVVLPTIATTNHQMFISNPAAASYMLIVKSGTSILLVLPPGSSAWFVPDGTRWIAVSTGTGEYQNYLINGGFNFAQRLAAPGTLTTVADNKYGPDRWRSTRENADLQYQRNDALGESGLTSQYYGTYKKITNAGKLHICQIIEGANSVPLRGKTVTFQIQLKASSAKTIRMAVLELQNAGTIDTIPATLVTNFNADSTDPTLGANVAVISAVESKSVTTAWKTFAVTVTVPTNSKNLICALWSDSDFAVNDTISLGEAGFREAHGLCSWKRLPEAVELARCQRYCEKITSTTSFSFAAGFADTTGLMIALYMFKVVKFAAPTMSYGSAIGDLSIRYVGAGTSVLTALTFPVITVDGVTLLATPTGTPLTAGQGCNLRAVNANAYIMAEAEL